MQEAPSICAKDNASDVGKPSLSFPNTIHRASLPSSGSTLLYCRARLLQGYTTNDLQFVGCLALDSNNDVPAWTSGGAFDARDESSCHHHATTNKGDRLTSLHTSFRVQKQLLGCRSRSRLQLTFQTTRTHPVYRRCTCWNGLRPRSPL
ncbi:hypothetical protein IG631_03395 [Alternaria alternata]|nr:hypothetical protein IG631_03395 [Alternaria alternata]